MKKALELRPDLKGRIFGGYKVTDKDPVIKIYKRGRYRANRRLWECVCLKCDKATVITEENLKRNKHGCRSCSREFWGKKLGGWVKANRKTYADSGVGSLYRIYQKNMGEKRGLSFELSYESFSALTALDCYYCGAKPRPYNVGSYRDVIANGVDRKNNTLGYIEGNCVPCCTACNWEKNDWTEERVYKFFPHLKPSPITSEVMLWLVC